MSPSAERSVQRKYVFAMDDHGDRPVMSNPFYGEVLAGAAASISS